MKAILILSFTLLNVNSISRGSNNTNFDALWKPSNLNKVKRFNKNKVNAKNANSESIKIIKYYEKFHSKAYTCPAGKHTIGYGFTGTKKSTITKSESEILLKSKYNELLLRIESMPGAEVLNNQQKAALVSLSYNIGINALRKSTLMKKVKSGDIAGAGDEFKRWNKATVDGVKVVLDGLTARRVAEKELWDSI